MTKNKPPANPTTNPHLNLDDRKWWERLLESVRPLQDQTPTDPAKTPPPPSPKKRKVTPPPLPSTPPEPPRHNPAKPLERRRETALQRGDFSIDRRLDLHGLTADEAFRRIYQTIDDAHRQNQRHLLIITGKGRCTPDGRDVGILRQQLPRWLAHPDLQDKILALRPAHAKHGGGGAFYVILKKAKK